MVLFPLEMSCRFFLFLFLLSLSLLFFIAVAFLLFSKRKSGGAR